MPERRHCHETINLPESTAVDSLRGVEFRATSMGRIPCVLDSSRVAEVRRRLDPAGLGRYVSSSNFAEEQRRKRMPPSHTYSCTLASGAAGHTLRDAFLRQ